MNKKKIVVYPQNGKPYNPKTWTNYCNIHKYRDDLKNIKISERAKSAEYCIYHKHPQNDCLYKAPKYFLNDHYIIDKASSENKRKVRLIKI